VCIQLSKLSISQQNILKPLMSSFASDISVLMADAVRKSKITVIEGVENEDKNSSATVVNDSRNVLDFKVCKPHPQANAVKQLGGGPPDTLVATRAPASTVGTQEQCIRSPQWIMQALTSGSADELVEAGKEVKLLAKSPAKDAWAAYSNNIVSVILEAFSPDKCCASMALESLPVTGFSPIASRQLSSVAAENIATPSERLFISSKILLAIARYKGEFLKGFTELLVSRLCTAAAFSPIAVTLHSKEILSIVAAFDASRMLRLVLPFATYHAHEVSTPFAHHVRLLALQVLAEAVKFVRASLILQDLGALTEAVMPSLGSDVVGTAYSTYDLLYSVVCSC
jgi:hypothetical protein